MTDVLQSLGLPKSAKAVIIVCNEFGVSHSHNTAALTCLRTGAATSAALQIPCPWARNAAATHAGEDVGISLTCNAEYETYRWGPITTSPSLLDGDGGFPRTVSDMWEHADPAEVYRESQAQIERAILWGFDLTHIRSHLDALLYKPEFFDVCLELAKIFDLPLSLPSSEIDLGFPAKQLAADAQILTPDYSIKKSIGTSEELYDTFADLQPGVTEVPITPAKNTAELQAFHHNAQKSITDATVFEIPLDGRQLKKVGVTLIGFKEIRQAQRVRNSK